MRFTIFGGRGFVGSRLADYLRSQAHEVITPSREADELGNECLGHVIYAIGLTGDFRRRPYDTIEAHVTKLSQLLRKTQFESWLYLSSTRLYGLRTYEPDASEEVEIMVRPSADSLYDLSKLLGESLCLAHSLEQVRVARLSNVFGAGQSDATFLGSVLRSLQQEGATSINESPESAKDYVAIEDVVQVLPRIAVSGQQRLYNVASGRPTTHAAIAETINAIVGKGISFASHGATRVFPTISISRLQHEFASFRPRRIEDCLGQLIRDYGI